eukprot:CAMPEP_0181413516 /NCGR_PEP_ID=MMETSP1110-20121109/9014_1 /TAXON_ID=174948 /ORGANISM="Symbiodinium sp., Strain CCMP421" /LENGTH=554 /DNA_ID=CAMNT_0023536335 /DNA_START=1 /DNA_END=1665 /DNA_ORIENTATION=-
MRPERRGRLQEYQQNTAFVGFMMLVCTSAVVYLTQALSTVLVPLMWAAFTAMPLTGLISVLNPLLIKGMRCCSIRSYRPVRNKGEKRPWYLNRDVAFEAKQGEAFLRLPKTDGELLLEEVNEPDWVLLPRCLWFRTCCRRKVRVKDLRPDGGHEVTIPDREVNRLVNSWEYYIRRSDADEAGSDELMVELFLDHAEHYPALVPPLPQMPNLTGSLEVDSTHAVSYWVAIMVAMAFVALFLALFVWLISVGANTLSNNVGSYVHGGQEFIVWANGYAQEVLPPEMSKDLDHKAQNMLNEQLPELASSLLTMVEGLGFEILLFTLYLLFWTLEPLPINREVSNLFKTYLLQKSLVCLLFAALTSLMLLCLHCALWHILFLVCFLLNYIPEVGPIVVFCLILPLILLDGNQTLEQRGMNSFIFTIGFFVIKFVTGNIIEVQLYAKSGGDLMRMHPVVMLALMMLFQSLMGMTGMFMTVPVMAAAKYYMLSMNMPSSVLDPLLTCIEGSEQGPHMNYVEQQRAKARKSALDPSSDEDNLLCGGCGEASDSAPEESSVP